MLPPLPSTNWRIQSFLPTAQISFLIASASGVENRRGFGAWLTLGREEATTGLGAWLAMLPATAAILCFWRRSRAEGVMTQLPHMTILVAPTATASWTSRAARTLRFEMSKLLSCLLT